MIIREQMTTTKLRFDWIHLSDFTNKTRSDHTTKTVICIEFCFFFCWFFNFHIVTVIVCSHRNILLIIFYKSKAICYVFDNGKKEFYVSWSGIWLLLLWLCIYCYLGHLFPLIPYTITIIIIASIIIISFYYKIQ